MSDLNRPLENSYWVVPGRLLAGEYPYGADDTDTRRLLFRLRDAGINYYIDLTQDGERPGYRRLLPLHTRYLRCAIADTKVPQSVDQMREIQARIRAGLLFGRSIYVHCRAGIGRTALVVGCYLAEQGLTGKEALKQLNVLWLQSERSSSWPKVPQTQEQAQYIVRWPSSRKSAARPVRLRTR
ncbi:MAG: dual specificity protein phosphatase family protein [Steroidobacteraceae bacterium]|jgi:hypothetical protein